MERFEKKFNGKELLTIFVNYSILDIWQGSEYTSEIPLPLLWKHFIARKNSHSTKNEVFH